MSTSTVAAMPQTIQRSQSSITTLADFRSKVSDLINVLSQSDQSMPVTQLLSQNGDDYSLSANIDGITISLSLISK